MDFRVSESRFERVLINVMTNSRSNLGTASRYSVWRGSWRGGGGVPNPISQPNFGPNPSFQPNFGPNPSYQIWNSILSGCLQTDAHNKLQALIDAVWIHVVLPKSLAVLPVQVGDECLITSCSRWVWGWRRWTLKHDVYCSFLKRRQSLGYSYERGRWFTLSKHFDLLISSQYEWRFFGLPGSM